MGYNGKIQSSFKNNKLTIQIPEITSGNNLSGYAWVFKIENAL